MADFCDGGMFGYILLGMLFVTSNFANPFGKHFQNIGFIFKQDRQIPVPMWLYMPNYSC